MRFCKSSVLVTLSAAAIALLILASCGGGNHSSTFGGQATGNITVANNQCNGSFNCVVLASNGSVHPLLLSSEATTGIKIPSGQIGGGGVTVPPNQTADLNIDFNACQSIVLQPNGQFRLKPVLHAGEGSLSACNSLSGTVVDSVTHAPISGGMVIVA